MGQDQGLVVRYLMMNNQKKPFHDKKVSQAINYAINKEAYVAVVKNEMCIRDRYLSICLIFSVGVLEQVVLERILQGNGKTIYTMITQGAGAVINLSLIHI